MSEDAPKTRKPRTPKRKPQNFSAKDLNAYILDEAGKTGKSKEEILEETFHDGFIVVSESADGAFKVEGGQLFKPVGDKVDDLTECRRLRERFGPISACVEYIKDVIMGSGFDIIVDDFHDERQRKIQKQMLEWMDTVYQDVYTVGLNALLDILVDNALVEGFAAAEIVFSGAKGDLFNKYAKVVTSSVISQEGGRLQKSDTTSYEISDPNWEDLKGIARLKIFLDAPTRLRLYRKGSTWEADYWVLDQPNVAGAQGGMTSSTQKNLQQGVPMQMTSADLVASTMPNGSNTKSPLVAKPSAYFLPWQIFSLSLARRTWLEKGPSIILPAMKTAQLLEKIMNAVGEGIYRAGNKKYFIICGTKDRPWGAIHIRNLLSQIKDASEKNWSTIPVPAGFDLKEAGGQVFEAQNAINYFLRIIAGIMHVNPSVLGLDTREARNVSEYPYFTHLRMKESLKNQIRTQLIRLHIWATYGEKLSKQGGFTDPQWIPQLRSKTEDLLNPADRLNLDIAILNAANPVMPQTKLEVERDIILTRGWEVDLPTQEEFMKEQNDQKQNQKKQDDADTKFKLENSKAQLEDLKNRNNPEHQPKALPQPSGNGNGQPTTQAPKTMGPPNPPSPDKQEKKLQNSTNKKGKSPKQPARGTTRKPAEVQESKEGEEVQESLENDEIQEPIPIESQKVDVNINVTTKSEPIKTEPLVIKTEKQEIEVTVKQAEPKPQEPTKIELNIKNEPVVVKAEKQEIEIKLKEDESKSADEKEIREKKKKLLDDMSKQVQQEVESQ